MGSTAQSSINADVVAVAAENGWKITTVQAARPPAGYTDLAVYQPNPLPGAPNLESLGKWLETLEHWQRNQFELPPGFQPISGVSGLIIAARRACSGGRKLRQLRIMGHGSIDFLADLAGEAAGQQRDSDRQGAGIGAAQGFSGSGGVPRRLGLLPLWPDREPP